MKLSLFSFLYRILYEIISVFILFRSLNEIKVGVDTTPADYGLVRYAVHPFEPRKQHRFHEPLATHLPFSSPGTIVIQP